MCPSSAASTLKIQRSKVIEAVLSSQISGLKHQWNHFIGALTQSERPSGRRMASVFGICSPTTTWIEVTDAMATVHEIAAHPPFVQPHSALAEQRGDQPVDEWLRQCPENQAADGDPELSRGKERVDVRDDLPRQHRPPHPPARLRLVDDLIELTGAHLDQAQTRPRRKTRSAGQRE